MSILNWFFKNKRQASGGAATENKQRASVGAAAPQSASDRSGGAKPEQSQTNQVASRKAERLQRRELLYSVVRDTMIRAGLLAASYRFKVLSLDAHGRRHLIMMDLANGVALDSVRFAEIEAVLAQAAKAQHGILVTAVYWRVNEPVTTGQSRTPLGPVAKKVAAKPDMPSAAVPDISLDAVPARSPDIRFDPIHEDEVAAFNRALASATNDAGASDRSPPPPGKHHAALDDEFESTQVINPSDIGLPMSTTQYGDLR